MSARITIGPGVDGVYEEGDWVVDVLVTPERAGADAYKEGLCSTIILVLEESNNTGVCERGTDTLKGESLEFFERSALCCLMGSIVGLDSLMKTIRANEVLIRD